MRNLLKLKVDRGIKQDMAYDLAGLNSFIISGGHFVFWKEEDETGPAV